MLAVQMIQITWTKEHRNPSAAALRRQFFQPHLLADDVNLAGDGVFISRQEFVHSGETIIPTSEYVRQLQEQSGKCRSMKVLQTIAETETAFSGNWSSLEKHMDFEHFSVLQEGDVFRVRWHYDDGKCRKMPIRNGHNEEYHDLNSQFYGKDIRNETAFLLHHGEAGKLQFNYRVAFYDYEMRQHYEQYCIYFVHTDIMTRDLFTSADYTHEYNQLAHLF